MGRCEVAAAILEAFPYAAAGPWGGAAKAGRTAAAASRGLPQALHRLANAAARTKSDSMLGLTKPDYAG